MSYIIRCLEERDKIIAIGAIWAIQEDKKYIHLNWKGVLGRGVSFRVEEEGRRVKQLVDFKLHEACGSLAPHEMCTWSGIMLVNGSQEPSVGDPLFLHAYPTKQGTLWNLSYLV